MQLRVQPCSPGSGYFASLIESIGGRGVSVCRRRMRRRLSVSLGRIRHAGAAAAWLSGGPSSVRSIHRVRTRLEGESHMWREDARECRTDSADAFQFVEIAERTE